MRVHASVSQCVLCLNLRFSAEDMPHLSVTEGLLIGDVMEVFSLKVLPLILHVLCSFASCLFISWSLLKLQF